MEKKIYSIENKNGMKACVLNYGAILQALYVPNKDGKIDDVVLGYDNLDAYEKNAPFFGGTIGPVGNRTENASYQIGNKTYQMEVNDNENNLHSSIDGGYHKAFFDIKKDGKKLICTLLSKDGDVLGSPGNKKVTVSYELTDDNELIISYHVTSDKETWINMTNHSYFNLNGHDSGVIESHYAQVFADAITEVRAGAIPTGKLLEVEDTPMDFRVKTRILDRIEADFEQLKLTSGYDHNYVLNNYDGNMRRVAILSDDEAGREMEVYTDLPGVQMYAGNFIMDEDGKNGTLYKRRNAVCFETQYYPNAINDVNFPSPITGPGKPFETKTIYKFI
jgi:aldose 1-epimerase